MREERCREGKEEMKEEKEVEEVKRRVTCESDLCNETEMKHNAAQF